MNPKYDSYLLSELIEKKLNNVDIEEINDEIYSRLNFCGFDIETAKAFIELEEIIIKKRNLKFKSKLCDTYWWLKNRGKSNEIIAKVLEMPFSEYFLRYNEKFKNYQRLPDNLLTSGELISLMDEATYIDAFCSISNKKIQDEINIFKSTNNNFEYVLNELYFRIMASYEMAHNNSNFPENLEEVNLRLYYNEKNIIFNCKWLYRHRWQNYKQKKWKSYTSEYYNYYK